MYVEKDTNGYIIVEIEMLNEMYQLPTAAENIEMFKNEPKAFKRGVSEGVKAKVVAFYGKERYKQVYNYVKKRIG